MAKKSSKLQFENFLNRKKRNLKTERKKPLHPHWVIEITRATAIKHKKLFVIFNIYTLYEYIIDVEAHRHTK